MANGTIKRTLSLEPQMKRITLQAYSLGSTIQVPLLPLRDEDYTVIVIFTYANINSLYLIPQVATISAGTRNFYLPNAWDTNSKTLKTSGNVDLHICFIG